MNVEKFQEQISKLEEQRKNAEINMHQLEEQRKITEINMHRLAAAIIAYKDALSMIVGDASDEKTAESSGE